jgi:tRNA(His) 5'-end guanylyltransferase
MNQRQSELQCLLESFALRENEALQLPEIPDDAYLGVRLDGIRHSKMFLKDHLENDDYNAIMRDSIHSLHAKMKTIFAKEYPENFVCACSFTDEVSFVLLNRISNERYKKRTMKICTSLCGGLSSAMTRKAIYSKSKRFRDILSFDARPIYLSNINDIVAYIRHRYLLASRQAFWKVLRLRDYPGWETDEIKKNYDNARAIVEEKGWADEAETIRKSFRIYLPHFTGLKQVKLNGTTRSVRNYQLKEIHPTGAYCSDGKLGEGIDDLLDELGAPGDFIEMIFG